MEIIEKHNWNNKESEMILKKIPIKQRFQMILAMLFAKQVTIKSKNKISINGKEI